MFQRVAENLEKYMNVLGVRQKLVASNIANADTPGYQSSDVNFQTAFKNALNGQAVQARPVENLPVKTDGNNVSLDREARMLAETAIRFQMVTQLARGEIRSIRGAIQDGKQA
jgi:flagellar basal-body rod protein FlgB